MPDSTFNQRVKSMKELLGAFWIERMVYLVATVAALILLFFCALQILRKGGDSIALIGVVSGSGGLLYTTNRILRMWSDALAVVAQRPIGDDA